MWSMDYEIGCEQNETIRKAKALFLFNDRAPIMSYSCPLVEYAQGRLVLASDVSPEIIRGWMALVYDELPNHSTPLL